MNKFKDYILESINEGHFDDCPNTGALLKALGNVFARYYADEVYNVKTTRVNPADLSDSLNPTYFFLGKGNFKRTIDFVAVCIKFEAMFNFIKERIRDNELSNKITSVKDAYAELDRMYNNTVWHVEGADAIKKQTPIIFKELKKELKI